MKKYLLLVLLCSFTISAQFNKTHYDLIKTTFERGFDKTIISNHLNSNNPDDVKAGLLSLAHSDDTTWVTKILNLDYMKFGKYISFALGKLGPSKQSSEFLISKIKSHSDFNDQAFESIGLCGDSSALKSLSEYMLNNQDQAAGFFIGLYNFNRRNINLSSDDLQKLFNKYLKLDTNEKVLKEILFAAARIGVKQYMFEKLTSIALYHNNNEVKSKAVAALRNVEQNELDRSLFKLITNEDFRVRIQIARTLGSLKLSTKNELEKYFLLLTDRNKNVSRTAAVSIKNIEVESNLKEIFFEKIKKLVSALKNKNTKGELFQSLCILDSNNIKQHYKNYSSSVDPIFNINVLSQIEDKFFVKENLLKYVDNVDPQTNITLIGAIADLQKPLNYDVEVMKYLISELKSESLPSIYMSSYNLDSNYVINNREFLSEIVLSQVNKLNDIGTHYESIVALLDLSKRVDSNLTKKVVNLLSLSRVYNNRKIAASEKGIKFNEIKSNDIFETLWPFAFKYKNAIVKTTKGNFELKFEHQLSPITCAAIIFQSEKKYFDNVIFHRVVPDFVSQVGDPSGTGWGGPGYEIISETSPVPLTTYRIGMASAGKDTEGSQWYYMHSYYPHLNGNYSNWGYITNGYGVADIIEQGDKIISIELK